MMNIKIYLPFESKALIILV